MNIAAVPELIETGGNVFQDIASTFGPTQAFTDREARKKAIEPILQYWRNFPKNQIPADRLAEFEADLDQARYYWYGGTAADLASFNTFSKKWDGIVNASMIGSSVAASITGDGLGGLKDLWPIAAVVGIGAIIFS